MNQRLLWVVLQIFISVSAFAQRSSIKGKVLDEKSGETMPGATVIVKGTTLGAQTDLDGNFTLNLQPGKYTIECRFISYTTKIIEGVVVKANESTMLNILIGSAENELGMVEVISSINKESNAGLLLMQKNSATVQDGISSESIKRTPDRSTSDVLKRVSGASIQDNKFAVIRGLNDRYNAAYLNGAPLPSSESDRKAFAFDIFPSNMLENLVIVKTATPDLPGEFAGGIIQITTKNIPEENYQTFSLGTGFNTITTGKEQITYQGGKLDWLGMDDGTRKLPATIPGLNEFPTNMDDQAMLAKSMKNDWALESKKFTPNYNFQYTSGFNKNLFKKPLGILLGVTYNRSNNYNETTRKGFSGNSVNGNQNNISQLDFEYLDKIYSAQTLAGTIANIAYKLSDHHSLGFKNIFSINADDRVIMRSGETNPWESNPTLLKSSARWFTGNKIYSGQINGDHLFTGSKLRLNWMTGLSSINREIPNLRRSVYTRFTSILDESEPNPKDTIYAANIAFANVGPSYGGGIFHAYTKEKIYCGKIDLSYDINLNHSYKNQIKAGAFFQSRNRTFDARQLGYTRYAKVGGSVSFNDSLLFLDEGQIFSAQNMGLISPGKGGFKLSDGTKYSDAYNASSDLFAGYLMFDHRMNDILRIIWGARAESFTQNLNAIKSDRTELKINSTKLDILPSANAIYSINEKQNLRLSYSQTLNRPEYRELAPFAFYDFNTQFVISGNDSLKRAKINNYDLRYEFFPGRGQILSGSVFFKEFINPIEQISRPDVASEISFKNVDKAINYGIELEFRQLLGALFGNDSSGLLSKITVFSNLAIIRSRVNVENILGSEQSDRPLQGQSPYVWNAGIQYIDTEKGHSFSASFNRIGPRIAIVGNVNEPSIWENSRTFIDLQLTKSFLKNKLECKLNLQNLLAENQIFYQNRNLNTEKTSGLRSFTNKIFTGDAENNNGIDKAQDDIIWNTIFGRVISFSVNYKF